ncbi:MAG: DUF711 family protein, partial [Lachnospiraceae bacterium]|nr:DUF711 family protein [Lachnospiraceae bacterium]
MIQLNEVFETNEMIEKENFDVRTVTLGISLIDTISDNLTTLNERIYEKIVRMAENLCPTAETIERELGIPIVNKRIAVTPISLIAGAAAHCPEDFVSVARTMERAAVET